MHQLRKDDLSWQELDGHIIVLDLKSSVYLEINQAGSLLFPLLVRGSHDDNLEAKLTEAFGLEAEAAKADVIAFLASLRTRGLLEE